MPPTRRASKQSHTKIKNGSQSETNGTSPVENDQWVFLMNDTVLEEDPNEELKSVFCKLRHPKTDVGSVFLFTKGDEQVCEVLSFKEDHRSWFIEDTIQKDGSLFITTPVDPVFLAIPYLVKAEKLGKYMTLDQIILDDDYPECCRLTSTNGISEVEQIADTKGNDDYKAFRLNKDKLLTWLKAKMDKLTDVLMDRNFCVSGGQTATFIRSKRSVTASREDYERYAYGMVCDYLPVDISTEFMQYVGITPVLEKKDSAEPPSKKAKVDIAPTEDYSQNQQNLKPQKNAKMSAAQKQLSKVDKTGMKSLMSFFSPKSKA